MTETVAEALARHKKECPDCRSGYAGHCLERGTVQELAELRVDLSAALRRAEAAEAKVERVREFARSLFDSNSYGRAIRSALEDQ